MNAKPNWPRCPRCRSRRVTLTELWRNSAITWDADTPLDAGMASPVGEPYRVEADCRECCYRWKLRGVIQIKPEWFDERPADGQMVMK